MKRAYLLGTALSLILLLHLPFKASPCSLAYEQRYFMLGYIKGEPVMLETRMRRDAVDSHGENPKVFWTGDFTIVRKNSERSVLAHPGAPGTMEAKELKGRVKVLRIMAADFRFGDESYVMVLDSISSAARAYLGNRKGFTSAPDFSFSICEPGVDCLGWHLMAGKTGPILEHSKTGLKCEFAHPSNVLEAANWLIGDISGYSFNVMGYTRVIGPVGNFSIIRLSGGEDYEGLEEALKKRTSFLPKEVHYEHGICFELIVPDWETLNR